MGASVTKTIAWNEPEGAAGVLKRGGGGSTVPGRDVRSLPCRAQYLPVVPWQLPYWLRVLIVYGAKHAIIRVEDSSASEWDGEGCA